MPSIGARIRELRESIGEGRTRFAQRLGVPVRTIQGLEQRGSSPRGDVLEAIAREWPQYSYWLLTGETMPEQGQISPEIERARRDSPGEERVS